MSATVSFNPSINVSQVCVGFVNMKLKLVGWFVCQGHEQVMFKMYMYVDLGVRSCQFQSI